MSDNLVWQWDEYVESMGCVMGEVEHMAQQMRDRIEELEAKMAGQDLDVHPVEMAARIKELEAQLAEATALIAELKGQDNARS